MTFEQADTEAKQRWGASAYAHPGDGHRVTIGALTGEGGNWPDALYDLECRIACSKPLGGPRRSGQTYA